jgi:hypothetical protein
MGAGGLDVQRGERSGEQVAQANAGITRNQATDPSDEADCPTVRGYRACDGGVIPIDT